MRWLPLMESTILLVAAALIAAPGPASAPAGEGGGEGGSGPAGAAELPAGTGALDRLLIAVLSDDAHLTALDAACVEAAPGEPSGGRARCRSRPVPDARPEIAMRDDRRQDGRRHQQD